MAIVPDTKSWTWVLERPCPECGFDASTFPSPEVSALLRENAQRWTELLTADDVGKRPDDSTWSTLEYACHVRDVFVLFDERLRLMLEQDEPRFANWDQDETAVSSRYGEQDPAVVSADLYAAALALADRFETVSDGQWERTGVRSDGAFFTVDSFARYLVHDPVHHVWDVTRTR